MASQNVTTTVTRTVKVEFDQDAVRELLRKQCGAPDTANVELEFYSGAVVTWSTTEEQP